MLSECLLHHQLRQAQLEVNQAEAMQLLHSSPRFQNFNFWTSHTLVKNA